MRLNTCTLTNHCTHVVSKNNHDLFCHLYIYLLEFWLVCLCYNWQNIKVRITLVWGVCFAFFVWKTVRWWVNLKTAAFLKRNLFWQRIDSNGLDINHTFCFKLWNLELNIMCHYTEKKTFLQAHTILFFLIILSTEDLFGLFFQWASSTAFHLKLLCTIPCKLFQQHTRKWHPKRTGYFQLYGPSL